MEHSRNGQEAGQALPLGIAMLLMGVLVGVVLYNTGQLANDKTRLANTADAAAYSGALWQARALNFQAYTNRAMVANQVSIAQAISLRSWSNYAQSASQNAATVLAPVPFLNGLSRSVERGLDVVSMLTEPLADALFQFADRVNNGLSMAQQAMYQSAFAATPGIVRTVVSETDPRFTVDTPFTVAGAAKNAEDWARFTSGRDADDVIAMEERRDVVERSLDRFSRSRNWDFLDFWLPSSPITFHRMERRGETRLAMRQGANGIVWEWQARDTLALQNKVLTFDFPGFDWKYLELPIGWGQAYANTSSNDDIISSVNCNAGSSPHCGYWSGNKASEQLAENNVRAPGSLEDTSTRFSGYGGVKAYRSLSDEIRQEESPILQYKLEVAMPIDETLSANRLNIAEQEDSRLLTAGGLLSAISVAEVYYQHPELEQFRSGTSESANGYNPYWSARLAPVPLADRALALALRPSGSGTSSPHRTPQHAPPGSSVVAAESTPDPESLPAGRLLGSIYSGIEPGGHDSSDLASLVGRQTTLEDIAATYGSQQLDELKRAIESEVMSVVEEAARGLLGAAFQNATGVQIDMSSTRNLDELAENLKEQGEQLLGDQFADSEVARYYETFERAREETERFREEFDRIKEDYARRLPEVWNETRAEIEREIATPLAKMEELDEELKTLSVDSDRSREIHRALHEWGEQIADIRGQLEERLVDRVLEVSREISDTFFLTRRMAQNIVRQMIQFGLEGYEMPWDEV